MYSICSYNLLRISPLFKCQICAKSPWFLPLSPSRCRSPEAWPSEITRASEIWSTSSLVSWLISWGRVHHLTWDSWDLDFSGSSCNSMDGWMDGWSASCELGWPLWWTSCWLRKQVNCCVETSRRLGLSSKTRCVSATARAWCVHDDVPGPPFFCTPVIIQVDSLDHFSVETCRLGVRPL